ncbi:retrovirus-related pol polyprotein from transposon TNT 1-94, partial [Tanacetum coccineum]
MNHQTSTVPQVILHVAYQSPQDPTQLMTESPFVDSGFAIPVFSPGDDLIACLNKAMAFLIVVASSRFPTTNNQLRTSSNPRNQATIQDDRSNATSSRGNTTSGQVKVVKFYNCQGEGHMARQCTQPKRPRNTTWYKEKAMLAEAQEAGQILDKEQLAFLADPGIPVSQTHTVIPHNDAFQTEDLDTYDSDCDDLSTTQAVLMANISNYGSDVISEANKEQNNESITAELERYKQRVKTFEQRLNIDLSSREKMIDSQMDDMIKEKLALKEQVDSLEQNLSKQIKEKESILQTFAVFKNESKEKENKYMENEIDLEKKIKELDNIICKVGQSAQTVHMLTKPQAFYDNTHKQALGYQNPFYLKNAQRIKPTLYDGVVMSNAHVAMPFVDVTVLPLIRRYHQEELYIHKEEMAPMALLNSKVNNDKSFSKTYLTNYEALKKQYDDLVVKLDDTGFKAAIYKRVKIEDASEKAMCAIDGAGFDWSDMAEEEIQANMALMAFSDSEVTNDKSCSKSCLKNYEALKKQYDDLLVKLDDTGFKAATYKRGLSILEGQILKYKEHEVLFSEEIALLKRSVGHKEYQMGLLRAELEKVKQEKEGFEFKIAKFDKSAKDLEQLLGSQITDKSKKGFGYNVVPSPHPLILNRPTTLDLSYSGLEEFKEPEVIEYGPRDSSLKSTTGCDKKSKNSKKNTDDSLEQHQMTDTQTSSFESPLKVDKDWKEKFFYPANHVESVNKIEKPVRKNNDAPINEDWVSDDEDEVESPVVVKKKIVISTATKIEKPVRKQVRYDEMYRSQRPRGNQRNWNGQKSNQLG